MTDTSLTTLAAEITSLKATIAEKDKLIEKLWRERDLYRDTVAAAKLYLQNSQRAMKDMESRVSHAEQPTNGQESPAQGTIGTLADKIRKGRRIINP